MRYAITGATGILGQALIKRWPPESAFSGDIRDFDQVSRWVHSLKNVDSILHLAALVPKQIVDMNPRKAFETNAAGTLNILDALRQIKDLGKQPPWVFYASTSHVYAPSQVPIAEDSTRKPFTLYGLTKLQGEQWCEAYAQNFGLDVCIGRIFSFSAPDQPDYYFIPAMFKKIREAPLNSTLTINGVQGYRDFLRVGQICEAIHYLSSKRCRGSYNIGTGKSHKLSDIVAMIAKQLDRPDITFEFPDAPADALVSENSKLKSAGLSVGCELNDLILEMASS